MLNSAQDLSDLRIPPANKLEKQKGNLQEFYSIRVNNKWRIIFQWIGNDAYEVKIVDYR
jgi:proteic killer suppression protein